MNNQELIKDRKSYKVGYCVKINRSYSVSFPPTEIYTIVELSSNNLGALCYVLDREPHKSSDVTFHYSYVFRDEDCRKMERKLKLDKLNDS